MKYLLVVCSILFISFSVTAQLTKKNWLVGGSGSYYSYKEYYSNSAFNQIAKYTSIDIATSVGYFIVNKFAAGLRPSFNSFKGKVLFVSNGAGGGSANAYNLSIGPFARYYFLKVDKHFNLLIDASYQVGIHTDLGGIRERGKYNTLSIMGGTELFFNETAGIEILLGYTNKIVSIENSPNAATNNKKGLQVSIGFNLHLQKL